MSEWEIPLGSKREQAFPGPLSGRVERHRFPSQALRGNPLGDPTERDLPVYLPPSGDTRGKPLLLLLSGYTGFGAAHFLPPLFLREPLGTRLDRLMRSGAMAEAVVVAPDCLTSLGGSQYLNSTATGPYEDYVMREILPWVQSRYGTGPTAAVGTSSGGYGSVVLGLRWPDVIQAVGSDAGDMCFEYCYLPDFPIAARAIRAAGGPQALLTDVFSHYLTEFGPRNPKLIALETMAYASAYSPDPDHPGRFDLPFDWNTGRLLPDVWSRWLAWDPVRMIEEAAYAQALRDARVWSLVAGVKDEYALDIGARVFVERAGQLGARAEFEEFDGGHADGKMLYDRFVPRVMESMGFPAHR
ncbi:MAG TPA: alpha/beta hydrolase-fold protein [Thermoplasmata archaeon]|nr:alpha/beta hydrolase-fold protein [Thermoplasmata archaeon]